jgi:hypothetical protein
VQQEDSKVSDNGQGRSRREAYLEKLKDPRWQRRRLEIMQRDAWACQMCGTTTQTLAVHHLCYQPGKDPWESANEELLTVCESCHDHETRNIKEARNEILHRLRRMPWQTADLHMLSLFLFTVQAFHKNHSLERETIIVQSIEELDERSESWDALDAYDAERNKKQRAIWQDAL